MAKRAYIVLALREEQLADFIKRGDHISVLKARRGDQRALFFTDFLSAQQFCAIANQVKFEYREIPKRGGFANQDVTLAVSDKVDGDGKTFYCLQWPDKILQIQLGQTIAYPSGESVTLEMNEYVDEDEDEKYTSRLLKVTHRTSNSATQVFEFFISGNKYNLSWAKEEQRFDHTSQNWWQQLLAYDPTCKMVILEVDVDAATYERDEFLCVVTPRTKSLDNVNKARYFYLGENQEKLLKGEALSARIASTQRILGISRVCYTHNGAWYWSDEFQLAYRKLDLLRDLIQHIVAQSSDETIQQDLALILNYIEYPEIHRLFSELALEIKGKLPSDPQQQGALCTARNQVEQAFMARRRAAIDTQNQIEQAFIAQQAAIDRNWKIAYWFTAGIAWVIRMLFFNTPEAAKPCATPLPVAPREVTFKIAEIQQGMLHFYQYFTQGKSLGYERRAANIMTYYHNPTNFLNYLKEKQSKSRLYLPFNQKGELSKQITAIDEAAGTVSIRGDNAQIERWELLTSFGKEPNSSFYDYKERLVKSKQDSQAMVRNHHYRPQL